MSYKLLESTELGMTLESERLNFEKEHDLQDVVVNDSEVVVVKGGSRGAAHAAKSLRWSVK